MTYLLGCLALCVSKPRVRGTGSSPTDHLCTPLPTDRTVSPNKLMRPGVEPERPDILRTYLRISMKTHLAMISERS